jgi:hybrid cluster-associated redox disulfide protein
MPATPAITPLTADQTVRSITNLLPESAPLLAEYGLHCFTCSAAGEETLRQGCQSHGFSDIEIEALVEDLNTLLRDRPPRPATLTLTVPAAKHLGQILSAEGQSTAILLVELDEAGAFYLSVEARTPADARTFHCREVPDVTVAASLDTLARIGGATIDHRDGRLKLDLPELQNLPTCGCAGGRCQCRR